MAAAGAVAIGQGRPERVETPFERSGGTQTATYAECIAFYQRLDKLSPRLSIREMGMSDAGYPLHLVLFSNDGVADPAAWHRAHKLVFLINNGIRSSIASEFRKNSKSPSAAFISCGGGGT